MNTQNSMSELLDKFILLQNNSLNIIQKINEAVVSDNESISFTLNDMKGNEHTYNFPSFGYLKDSLNRIDKTLQSLMGIGDGETIVQLADGSYKRVVTVDLATEPANILNLTVPSKFGTKSNWFFESFLSPLLHVSIDVSKYISQSTKRILCKRIIVVSDDIEIQTFFDTNYKGRNDIDLSDLYTELNNKGILYHEDEEIKDLPLSFMQYEGKFDVIDIKDIKVTNTEGVEKITRQYFLNKLTYDNNVTSVKDSETIKINDTLVCGDTIYNVTSVDAAFNVVTLKRISGYDSISVGSNILRMYTNLYSQKNADVNISFNERQVIFFKAIEESNNVVASQWSPGLGIFTNDLKITTTVGEQDLATFYQNNVIDFSNVIMSIAKEKTIPSIWGEIPDPPVIDESNFQVVRINDHLFDTQEQKDIETKSSNKVQLKSEIKQIENSIEENKQILGNTVFKTSQERDAVKNTINTLISEKTAKSNLYDSIVLDLTSIANEHTSTLEKPKYRVRGFFEIPEPKYNINTGYQEVIQFEYSYRYLRTDDKPAKATQFEFKGKNKQTKRATYTPWEYVKSGIRKRYYDEAVGIYKWMNEDIEDPEVANINQVDIPITQGEKVEIRVKSYSEAGWPVNPIESDWSESIVITFPDELWYENPASLALQQAQNEEAEVKFEHSLRAKNLDLHLSTSSQTGDNYYAHEASSIASGFFDNAGLIVNLYEKLKQLELEIQTLQNTIDKKKGILQVSIIDDATNTTQTFVENGTTVNLFAGYYTDYINQLSTNDKKGAIITKTYKLVIANTEKAPLELVSLYPGAIGELLPESTYDDENTMSSSTISEPGVVMRAAQSSSSSSQTAVASQVVVGDADYNNRRRYWEVPINNLSVLPEETKNYGGIYAGNSQSRQLRSQFLYLRKKNVGLSTHLYKKTADTDGIRYLTLSETTDRPVDYVWNYKLQTSGNIGGGSLSDFCVHTDCPILYPNNNSNWDFNDESLNNILSSISIIDNVPADVKFYNTPDICLNEDNNLPTFKTSAFRHSQYFQLQSNATNGKVQLKFEEPGYIPKTKEDWDLLTYEEKMKLYPDKLGFYSHDRFLIGKNTCGCYLYAAPSFFNQLQVNGTDYRSTKIVEYGEDKAIVVPIIFQFRMVDYYGTSPTSGKVGGYNYSNPNALVQNIIYEKKLGIDISVKDEPLFSFDIAVSAKYNRNTQAENNTTVAAMSANSNKLQTSTSVTKPDLLAL